MQTSLWNLLFEHMPHKTPPPPPPKKKKKKITMKTKEIKTRAVFSPQIWPVILRECISYDLPAI